MAKRQKRETQKRVTRQAPSLHQIMTCLVNFLLFLSSLCQVAASVELGGLVNGVIDTFRKRLRHDLRTPLITIKGFATILIEDLKNSRHKRLLHELEKVLTVAEELRAQIDALVDRAGSSFASTWLRRNC